MRKLQKFSEATFSKLNHFSENTMYKATLYTTQLSRRPRSLFLGLFVEIITSNCIILWLPEMMDNCWDQFKSLKVNEMLRGTLKAVIFLDVSHTCCGAERILTKTQAIPMAEPEAVCGRQFFWRKQQTCKTLPVISSQPAACMTLGSHSTPSELLNFLTGLNLCIGGGPVYV